MRAKRTFLLAVPGGLRRHRQYVDQSRATTSRGHNAERCSWQVFVAYLVRTARAHVLVVHIDIVCQQGTPGGITFRVEWGINTKIHADMPKSQRRTTVAPPLRRSRRPVTNSQKAVVVQSVPRSIDVRSNTVSVILPKLKVAQIRHDSIGYVMKL